MNPPHKARTSWWWSLLVAIAATLIIFRGLGVGSIWSDEAFSVELAKQSLGQMLRVTLSVEGNMFVYYFLMHFWLAVLHALHIRWSAFWVRVPSALAFIMASLTLWRLGDYLLGRIGGAVAVMLWWAFPWAVTYAQQARSFAFLFWFAALSFYAMVRLIDAQDDPSSQRWGFLYGLATLFGVYSFLDMVFYTMAQLLWMTWAWRAGRINSHRYQLYGAIVAGAAFLSLPLVPSILHGGQVSWVPLQTLPDILRYPNAWIKTPPQSPITVFIVLGVSIGIVNALTPRKGHETHTPMRRAFWLGLSWLILPLLLEYLVFTYLHFHILDAVYALPATMGIALSSAAGWLSLRSVPVSWAVLVATFIVALPQWPRGQGISLENWRTPVLTWAKGVKPDQSIVAFDNTSGVQYTLQYFIDAHHLPITIRPYPGHFTWTEYIKLNTKGAYFARAVSVPALRQDGILLAGHQVWFAFAEGPMGQARPLLTWLSHHAVLKERLSEKGWPVGFQLYQITGR